MLNYVTKSLSLLFFLVVIICGIYPLLLWTVGQTIFPFQANGSILLDSERKPVGSKLIAQPFTKDEYFHPRPSAASYDASASASSALAASNYALRDRVSRFLGSMIKYNSGQSVAPDIEKWFQQDHFQNKPNIVSQWVTLHNALADAWLNAAPMHAAYAVQYIKDNPEISQAKAEDLAIVFFQNFSKRNPGKFPSSVSYKTVNGKMETRIEPVSTGSDIQSIFFDMWLQEHPDVLMQDVPGDLVTTSASGLDPHITLKNAEFQLEQVAQKWATNLKRDPAVIRDEIQKILQQKTEAPFSGLLGEKYINVLEVNLELYKQYGSPL